MCNSSILIVVPLVNLNIFEAQLTGKLLNHILLPKIGVLGVVLSQDFLLISTFSVLFLPELLS